MTEPQDTLIFPTKAAIAQMPIFKGLELKNIHLVTTSLEAEVALEDLLRNQFLGFDTESRPTFRKGEVSEGPHVLQFATLRCAYIFQTHQQHCEPAIVKILASKRVAKIGFGLDDDIKRIGAKFQIEPQSIIDMDTTFKRRFGQKNSVGVKSAIAHLFNQRLLKSRKITTTNWSNIALTEQQLLYAANDAFAAIAAYAELKKRGVKIVRKVHPKQHTENKTI